MPTISLFYGIVIQMYWRDHNPPHIHALYQGHEALFAIEDTSIIAGKLPPTARKIVEDWIARRRPEFDDELGARPALRGTGDGCGSRCR